MQGKYLCEHITDDVNIYFYECVHLLVPVRLLSACFLGEGDIESEYKQKACHQCITFSELVVLMHQPNRKPLLGQNKDTKVQQV